MAPRGASREETLFLGAYGDNLEFVSATLILDELHIGIMSHSQQDESRHLLFKLGPPEYVPSQVHQRRGNVVSLSANIRTPLHANHENTNTMRFGHTSGCVGRPLGYPKQ